MTDDEKAKDAFVLDDDSYLKTEIEKIRGRWELATVFEPVIGVDLKLTAEEIESALVKPNKSLAQLHIKLLKGIPPMSENIECI
ncbi:hypothetical protein OIU74_028256 [Salix koriyanagi]|uniref:Uncharacterized protein n=1 Tax=Salix koriyanagi TaxID=2511006 RepID=A0A9Q0VBT1_9ROSI|nr:hypothetical protein OIU74_028256 [Salix koriyanagi]